MNPTAKQVGQTARDIAIKAAKQIAREPLEVLKTAGEQIVGPEAAGLQENPPAEAPQKNFQEQQKIQDKMKASRRMEALNQELTDIHKQDLFKDLQGKIAEGIEVPLEDYPELSMEQKQVLKAQMEAVRFQKQQAEYAESQSGGSLFGSPKKGRRFGQGQKQEAEKQQTRVEKPVPPSG
jgi:hypothetical protein